MNYICIFNKVYKESYREQIPFEFKLIKKVIHPDMSTFYSFVNHNNQILGFSRSHYLSRDTRSHKLKDSFDIETLDAPLLIGEDPRAFIHNDSLYVTDNYCHDQHIYNSNTKQRVKIDLNFKNTSYISHQNKLYGIHRMKPFELYEIDTNNGKATRISTSEGESNSEYRGGTPGYEWKPNQYIGFGHTTTNHPYENPSSEPMKHKVFFWMVDFNTKQPTLSIQDVEIPTSKLLLDPTSLIKKDGKVILVICESDSIWHHDQEFSTCFYEVKGF